jgi:hypothetical protein
MRAWKDDGPAVATNLRLATSRYRNIILDDYLCRPYIRPVPLNEGVSGDKPESERDAASCVRGL